MGESEQESDASPTLWDRVALGVVGILFGAYLYPPILNSFGLIFDTVFSVADDTLPFYAVVTALAASTGVYSVWVHRLFDVEELDTSNKSRMERLHKARIEAEAEGNEEKLEEVYNNQAEVMSEEFQSLKQQLRPLIWVFVGTMPVFIWIYWKVSNGFIDSGEEQLVIPVVGAVAWSSKVVVVKVWLVWYFLCSITANQVTRRIVVPVLEN